MDDIIAIYAGIAMLAIGFFFGIWMDVFKRAAIFRLLTKQEYGVLAIASPDNKQLREVVVCFKSDVIKHKGSIWVIEENKIFRADKPERGFRLDREDLPRKWVGGIPYIFVNENTFLPIDITNSAPSSRPAEISAVIQGWSNNQVLKGMSSAKNQQMLLTIALILSLIAAFFSFMSWMKVGDVMNQIEPINARTVAWANAGAIVNNAGVPTNVTKPNTPSAPVAVGPG